MSRKNWLLHLQFVFLLWVMAVYYQGTEGNIREIRTMVYDLDQTVCDMDYNHLKEIKSRLDFLSYKMDLYYLDELEKIKKALKNEPPLTEPTQRIVISRKANVDSLR